MNHNHVPVPTTALLLIALAASTLACGSDNDSASESASTSPPTTEPQESAATEPASPSTTNPVAETAAAPTTAPEGDWQSEVSSWCTDFNASIADTAVVLDGTAEGYQQFVNDFRAQAVPWPDLAPFNLSADTQARLDEVAGILDEGTARLDAVDTAAAGGDVESARRELDWAQDGSNRVQGLIALAGATCDKAEPQRVEAAALNVPTSGLIFQINAGFGSIWASRNLTGDVLRIDPATGETIATIAVGNTPQKLQAAGDRMWARTADRYVAIDPVTNTVAAELLKADVGPAANRSYAVDGALWICDGETLHRYDPATLQSVATIPTGVTCGDIQATDDLVVTWTVEEVGGAPAAAFVDPATNQLITTVLLPAYSTRAAVLDDKVFIPGIASTAASVVDRSSWALESVELDQPTAADLTTTDGTRIYVPAEDHDRDILVIDAESLEVVDRIPTLGNNAVALLDGSLWTADSNYGLIQRHDL